MYVFRCNYLCMKKSFQSSRAGLALLLLSSSVTLHGIRASRLMSKDPATEFLRASLLLAESFFPCDFLLHV